MLLHRLEQIFNIYIKLNSNAIMPRLVELNDKKNDLMQDIFCGSMHDVI